MARGDFIGGSESLANSQRVDIRPPEGETWLITGWGGTATSNVSLFLTDGTLLATMRGFSIAGSYRFKQLALFVTHDLYAVITNGSGSTQTVSWTGVVWKEAGTPPGPGDGVGAIQGDVAFGAVLTVTPPAGQMWLITDYGSSLSANGAPNLVLRLDGAYLVGSTTVSAEAHQEQRRLLITEDLPLELENRGNNNNVIGVCGVRVK